MRIILATGNDHKIAEIQTILQGVAIIPYFDLVKPFEIIENGMSFERNAQLKAEAVFEAVQDLMQTDDVVLADDSGLSVEALDGAPGIYSARYAQLCDTTLKATNDALNRKALIKALKDKGVSGSKGFYTAALCAMDAKGATKSFLAYAHGTVIDDERGEAGFGYDSLFVPNGHEQTWAQMSQTQKHTMSHRHKALMTFKDWLCA